MKPALSMTDIEREHTLQVQELTQRIGELCQQNNVVTKQRDALLEVSRAFVASDKQWEAEYQYMLLERLLDKMKDVVTVDSEKAE